MLTITNFRISSELKNVIGRDLITDDFVAIFELVKNSFDAHATDVKIVFDFNDTPEDAIYIIDNGKGMSADDIKNKWLFVAYSAKKDGSEDAAGVVPHYAGNKGVGRFSCDRLGRFLHMEAKTVHSSAINTVDIDWGDFEQSAKKEFGAIPVTCDIAQKFSYPKCVQEINLSQGVILKISSLRDLGHWSKKKILELKRALGKLIDPFNGQISKRRIEIISPRDLEDDRALLDKDSPEFINGDVENRLYELLENKTTALKARIEQNFLKIELIDRGMVIYKTEEEIVDDFPELLNISFDAVISFLNRIAKATFTKKMGVHSVDYGSLFLIRNEFRVFPIGEKDDDFWGLDRRKQQGYKRFIGTRELLGRISIQGEDESFNERFKEASSRNQGLIKTKAVDALQECVLRCIRKLEAYLTTVIWLDELDKDEDTPNRLSLENNKRKIIDLIKKLSLTPKISVTYYNKDLISILSDKSEDFQETLNNLKLIAEKNNDKVLEVEIAKAEKKLQQQQRALADAKKIAQAEAEARQKAETVAEEAVRNARKANEQKESAEKNLEEEQKRNLFLTASADRDKEILEGFLHQITMSSANAKVGMENALISLQSREFTQDKMRDILIEQLEVLENICTLSKFGTFANFRLNSGKIKDDICVFVEQYIQKVSKGFESMLELDCIRDGSKLIIEFNPMEIGMVIDNLISNSKKARATKFSINITGMSGSKGVLLEITDNGSGITEDYQRIFERGFTRTNGSGIGLFFCKKILDKIGADINVADSQPTHGARFIIRIVQ
ncbi:MAG: ATP-binding protein [Lentisphaerae bacterium]|nr:ATP-binding protein [Lentisphaerota bacterium]